MDPVRFVKPENCGLLKKQKTKTKNTSKSYTSGTIWDHSDLFYCAQIMRTTSAEQKYSTH